MFYIYGIINNINANFSKIYGFGHEQLVKISYSDIAAIVSRIDTEFPKMSANQSFHDLNAFSTYAFTHEKSIELVMEKTTILPMKFGVVYNNEEDIDNLLREKYTYFKENLVKLDSKVEIGIKIYYNDAEIKEKLLKEDIEIKTLLEESAHQSKGRAYFTQQKIEQTLKNKIYDARTKNVKEILDFLTLISLAIKNNDLINRTLIEKDMLLNVVILIKKLEEETIRKKLAELQTMYSVFEFTVAGPFPPYNFID